MFLHIFNGSEIPLMSALKLFIDTFVSFLKMGGGGGIYTDTISLHISNRPDIPLMYILRFFFVNFMKRDVTIIFL